MKKVISAILVIMFLGLNAQAASLKGAINKYKIGNFTECITDLNDVSKQLGKNKKEKGNLNKVVQIVSKYDDTKWKDGDSKSNEEHKKMIKELQKEVSASRSSIDKWTYLFYYYALSLHQLGYKGEAKSYYSVARKLTWESKSQIYLYSEQAVQCIDKPESCQSSDIDEFIKSGKQVSDDIIKDELKQNLKKHQKEINAGKDLSMTPMENDKLAWVDTGISSDIKTENSKNEMPTDEEIGKAVRTLQKAGINPMNYMINQNNEYAQLNALMNDGYNDYSNGYSNDYATMMMLNNQKGQVSPQLMQTLIQQQMMGGFGF